MNPNPAPPSHRLSAGSRQPRIAVIGGSLTGPVTALLLIRAGFDHVTVYESTPATAPLGGGLIGLEHTALDILDGLGIPQHEIVAYDSEAVVQIAVRNRRPAETVRRVYPGRNTTWTLLHRALAARLPGAVLCAGMRVTGLVAHAGQPVLEFSDGHTEPTDLVVFADGRSSTGRRLLDPERTLHYAGYVAHRGIANCIPHPDLKDFLRLQPCPGAQFNLAPVPGGCDWTFYLNCDESQYQRYFGATPDRRVFALPHHISPTARNHVNDHATQLLPPEHTTVIHATTTRMAVPVLDITPPTRMVWPVGDGHAVLIGDALAPVRPHTARGANNGIEQAAGLATALTQHHRYNADLSAALNGWQRRHLPTAIATIQQGPVIGRRLGLGAQ